VPVELRKESNDKKDGQEEKPDQRGRVHGVAEPVLR